MKSTFIASGILALATLSGASAFAQNSTFAHGDADYTPPTAFQSTVSRAQVKADYLNAQKAGNLPVRGDSEFAQFQPLPSQTTRAEVKADAVQWAKTHQADIETNM